MSQLPPSSQSAPNSMNSDPLAFLNGSLNNITGQNGPGPIPSSTRPTNHNFPGNFGRPPPAISTGPSGNLPWTATSYSQDQGATSFGHYDPEKEFLDQAQLSNHPSAYNPGPGQYTFPTPSMDNLTTTPQPLALQTAASGVTHPSKVQGHKRSKAPKLVSQIDLTEISEGVASRNGGNKRKNAYLPNTKKDKSLWIHRATNAGLIRAAVNSIKGSPLVDGKPLREMVEEAAGKEYHEKIFEQLSIDDRTAWKEIEKLVLSVEESFKLVAPAEREQKARREFSILHQDTADAFGIIPWTVNFTPGYGTTPPYTHFVNMRPAGRSSFINWFAKYHPELHKQFTGCLQGYCNYIWTAPVKNINNGNNISGDDEEPGSSEGEEASENEGKGKEPGLPEPSEIRDGIRIFPGISKNNSVHINRPFYRACLLDRLNAAGHKWRNISWKELKRVRADLVIEDHIPMKGNVPAALDNPNNFEKVELDAWMDFFSRHQSGSIPWEKGLLFKPTATVAAAKVFIEGDEDGDADAPENPADINATAGANPFRATSPAASILPVTSTNATYNRDQPANMNPAHGTSLAIITTSPISSTGLAGSTNSTTSANSATITSAASQTDTANGTDPAPTTKAVASLNPASNTDTSSHIANAAVSTNPAIILAVAMGTSHVAGTESTSADSADPALGTNPDNGRDIAIGTNAIVGTDSANHIVANGGAESTDPAVGTNPITITNPSITAELGSSLMSAPPPTKRKPGRPRKDAKGTAKGTEKVTIATQGAPAPNGLGTRSGKRKAANATVEEANGDAMPLDGELPTKRRR